MSATAEQYRKIDIESLSSTGDQKFNLFVKSNDDFVKFAGTEPAHQEKVRKLLKAGELTEDLYIDVLEQEEYYKQITGSLASVASDEALTPHLRAEKIYNVSLSVMKEFFENSSSRKILNSADDIMGAMQTCLEVTNQGFALLAKTMVKNYPAYIHSINVGLYCLSYAGKMKMAQEETKILAIGGLFHDLGLTAISDETLYKKGKLDMDEIQWMRSHTEEGIAIIKDLKHYNEEVVKMAAQHHESFDGKGYPYALASDKISYFSRVCKVADVYESLTSPVVYRKAMKPLDALTIMTRDMKSMFDPKVLRNFITLLT
ncbi:MAG: HD domain-containing protein [Nitrospina sp.]|jgi:putative nucleotidyltransferase with HDIG domain|nr:HD domain-containing protein [Nitrospina sp.]